MSAAVALLRERETVARRSPCSPERRPRSSPATEQAALGGQARTLDDEVAAAWAGLQAGAPIACPVCDAPMEPRWSAGAGVVGGRCRRCGSELS